MSQFISIKKTIVFFGLFSVAFMSQCQTNANQPDNNLNYQELVKMIRNTESMKGGNVNFVAAAAISTPCVVHIKTKKSVQTIVRHPFQDFFGNDFYFQQPGIQKQEGSGSGVIVSTDGYIATNNHVIQDADEIEVILSNKKVFKAKLIGTDKETDIALLKIEESNLPAMSYANSDSTMVGEWVLAVGNPFNLESTVTQGIVSAKGRSLNMDSKNRQINPIESFIQTDAAVNPGNSGGALVNLKGELIGINTAIASPTGAYAGYAFAVPSNLVKKVVQDIREYGMVQRAYLGISIANLTQEIAKELKLNSLDGIVITSLFKTGAAQEAGLEVKDVIVKINENEVKTSAELLEQISNYRPGDKIQVSYYRNGTLKTTQVTLKNKENTTSIVKDNQYSKIGLVTKALSPDEIARMGIRNGVRVTEIKSGIIQQSTDMKAGFIITTLNDKSVTSEQDIKDIIESIGKGTIIIEGFYPNRPYTFQYAFKL